jgi:hypothetical protein
MNNKNNNANKTTTKTKHTKKNTNTRTQTQKKGEQWQSALGLLREMPAMKISPNEISYNVGLSAS